MRVRKTDGRFEFDFTFDGRRVRHSVDCSSFVRFLDGHDPAGMDANLARGKSPMLVYDFIYDYYLPLQSKTTKKPSTHRTDRSTMKSIASHFGDMPLHRVQASDWENYKRIRMSSGEVPVRCRRLAEQQRDLRARRLKPCNHASSSTINREFSGLNQVLEYALNLGLVRQNVIANLHRLPVASRKEYWLRRDEITVYLDTIPLGPAGSPAGPAVFRDLAEFLVLTGARIGEALLFNHHQVNTARREIELATFKKRGKERAPVLLAPL